MKQEKRDFRCKGKNKKGRECHQLLFRYTIIGDEVTIVSKCPNCNSFNILTFKLISEKNDNQKHLS